MEIRNIIFHINSYTQMRLPHTSSTTGEIERIMTFMDNEGDAVAGVDALSPDGTPVSWRPDTGWSSHPFSAFGQEITDAMELKGRRMVDWGRNGEEGLGYGIVTGIVADADGNEFAECTFPLLSGAEISQALPLEAVSILPDRINLQVVDTRTDRVLAEQDVTEDMLYLSDIDIVGLSDGPADQMPVCLTDKMPVDALNDENIEVRVAQSTSQYFGWDAIRNRGTGKLCVPESVFRNMLESTEQCRMLATPALVQDLDGPSLR